MGQLTSSGANLTLFSLDSVAVLVGRLAAGGLVVGDNRRLRVLTFYSAQVCGASRTIRLST